MKLHRMTWIAAVSSLLIWPAAAQQKIISTDGSDPRNWDPKTDGPVAAPENHQVIFENENIRILSVTVLPGAREPYHSHARCSVIVMDRPAKLADHNSRNEVTPRVSLAAIPWQGKDVPAGTPFVVVQPPAAMHSIGNEDKHPLHLTRIELKHGCDTPPE